MAFSEHAFLALMIVFSITLDMMAHQVCRDSRRTERHGPNQSLRSPSTIKDFSLESIRPSLGHLLNSKKMKKKRSFVPTAYYQVFGSALNLSYSGYSLKERVQKKLGVSNIHGKTIREITEALDKVKVKSKMVFYGEMPIENKSALEFFKEAGIEIVKNNIELNKVLKDTILGGKGANLHYSNSDQVLLNIMSLRFNWFHTFSRVFNHTFRTSKKENIPTSYISEEASLKTIMNERFMAVKLNLAKEKLSEKDMHFYYRMNAKKTKAKDVDYPNEEEIAKFVRDHYFDDLEVYLVGQPNRDVPVPKMTNSFYKEVINNVQDMDECAVTLAFPAFNTRESTLPKGANILNFLASDYQNLEEKKTIKLEQKTFLCVDEKGIQGESPSEKETPTRNYGSIYWFQDPFYFMIVHKATKIPIVISYVDSVLEGKKKCSSV